jgi:orotidine-5'-phosphate decarboxylase
LTNNPIYCAIDTSDIDKAISLIGQIFPFIGGIKLGLEFFTSCGLVGLERVKKLQLPIFIDLKLYDIPNTVKQSLSNILEFEPAYTTLHLSGGSEMLSQCVKLKKNLNSKTKLIGVTMLTSFNDTSISEVGIEKSVKENVQGLTKLAINCGIDGIVCSPQEIFQIKKDHGSKLQIITPGIRNKENSSHDQKRTLSAKDAIDAGADIIVVGRPITEAKDPVKAAENIYSEIT